MRVPMIAGNWKMHKTIGEAQEFFAKMEEISFPKNVESVICAPFLTLPTLIKDAKNKQIGLGAQNMHWEEQGAFTGEISPKMLQDLGIQYVIIGHSERRLYFAETDQGVGKKVKAALAHQLIPIVCVGETLEERKSNQTKDVLKRQVLAALEQLEPQDLERLVIAYEPVWAIGTGQAATVEDAVEGIAWIREVIENKWSEQAAEKVRILYGGSVNPNNIAAFMDHSVIDGALVGGASLDPDSFGKLVMAAAKREKA